MKHLLKFNEDEERIDLRLNEDFREFMKTLEDISMEISDEGVGVEFYANSSRIWIKDGDYTYTHLNNQSKYDRNGDKIKFPQKITIVVWNGNYKESYVVTSGIIDGVEHIKSYLFNFGYVLKKTLVVDARSDSWDPDNLEEGAVIVGFHIEFVS